ncbi:lycopene cyclase family protein [Nannocystis sp. ILAH1]|uniref:lycopene cyclase family protein n=1 Tax=Nannocystis sp. ILAH1 TaxID=2996789 RepID=UPI0022714B76|nr:lycopene cyclase family protein [Nannocystis sp. ILAH1]
MRADYVIAGAGCAGLSLAVQIALQSRRRGVPCPRVVLIEPRARHARDRTWCYWRFVDHPFAAAVRHRWTRWRVADADRSRVRGSERHPYEHVPSDVFYDMALGTLAEFPEIELRRGCAVRAIRETASGCEVVTDAEVVQARLVFDSRPGPAPAPGGDEVDLLQHFVGWEVEAPAPVFDPEVPTLMDFAVDQSRGIHFMYVLPFAPTRALVETTYISPASLPDATYEDDLRGYLRARYGLTAPEVRWRERGAIAMTSRPAALRQSPRVIHLGLRGGLAKGSTGYAFQAIQRASELLARELLERPGAPPRVPAPRPAAAVAMDRVLLAHLQRTPSRGPPLFVDLFERLPPDLLCRFLSDHAGPLDYPRVMLATPMAEMTAAVVRSRALWLRAAT